LKWKWYNWGKERDFLKRKQGLARHDNRGGMQNGLGNEKSLIKDN
jgi:hypothetical protein